MMNDKVVSAVLYAVSSVVIMTVNKVVLFTWAFPSPIVLALAQLWCTFVVLAVARRCKLVEFPDPTIQDLRQILPLSSLATANVIFGLAGTGILTLPAFTVLRRTNILLTMGLEKWLLNETYSHEIKYAVAFILIGSLIATSADMQFNLVGYALTMMNNVCTSLIGVLLKIKLLKDSPSSIMYMNSALGVLLILLYLVIFKEEFCKAVAFEHWQDPQFQLMFVASSFMGVILQFSVLYCIRSNSALTTVIVGTLKNVVTAYIGMIDPRLGYTFNLANFAGVNLSMVGGFWYTHVQFKAKNTPLLPT